MPKPISSVPSTGAAVANAVSSIASTGINLWKQERENAQNQATNRAVADTHGQFLQLQDDAIMQQQEARGIQQQVKGFHEDGILDPKEAALLEQLNKRAQKLDLLDPNQRQLRKNALLKQALNDPALARVAHQVTNIFGGANVNPVADPQQEAIRQHMDGKYGAGQWSPVQVGEEMGRQNYMQQVSKEATENFTAVQWKAAGFAATAADDIIASVSKEIKTSGAWSPDSEMATNVQLANLHADTRAKITRAAQANKAGVDREALNKALEDVDNQFATIKTILKDNIDPFTLQKRLEEYNSIRQSTISGMTPTALMIIGNAGAGGNGAATQANLYEMHTAMENPRTRELLIANGANPAIIGTQVDSLVDWIINGPAAVDAKMAEHYALPFRKTIGVKLLKNKETQANPDAVGRVVTDLGEPTGNDQDTAASLDAINANIDVLTAKGSPDQVGVAVINHFKDFTSRQGMSPEDLAEITVVDGKIDMGSLMQGGGRMGQIKARERRAMISKFNDAIEAAGINAQDVISAVQNANPVIEGPDRELTNRERNTAARNKTNARKEYNQYIDDTTMPPAERARSGETWRDRQNRRSRAGVEAYNAQNPGSEPTASNYLVDDEGYSEDKSMFVNVPSSNSGVTVAGIDLSVDGTTKLALLEKYAPEAAKYAPAVGKKGQEAEDVLAAQGELNLTDDQIKQIQDEYVTNVVRPKYEKLIGKRLYSTLHPQVRAAYEALGFLNIGPNTAKAIKQGLETDNWASAKKELRNYWSKSADTPHNRERARRIIKLIEDYEE